MSVWKVVFSTKWLVALGLTVVFAIITTMFGLWQWDRRGQAVAEIERVENNWDAPAVAVDDLLEANQPFDDDLKWRPVVLTGEYLAEEQLLVRTRPRGGQVGFDVVVPFRAESNSFYLVSRGWVPTGESDDLPDRVPAPPNGVVEVVGRVIPGEPTIPGRSAPEGQLPTLNLGLASDQTGLALYPGAYVALAEESPAVSPTPLLQQRPQLDEGPHLSYTFQWYLFGILGFVAWGYLLREDYRTRKGLAKPERNTDRPSDQDIEDALLDQAEAQARR